MLLKPTFIVEHVTDINLDQLRSLGVKGFIFDLDNTIMAPHTGNIEEHIGAWLKLLEEQGFKMIVVSNNPIKVYTDLAQDVLNIPVIGSAAKPRRKHLRRALDMIGLDAHEVAVVGDRPLTDIWGGHRLGSRTILVDPLTKHKENGLIKCLRWLERLVIHPECENIPL